MSACLPAVAMTACEAQVVAGRISGVYGIKGWVKVFSYTQPRENILSYSPWILRRGTDCQTLQVSEGRRQGAGVVAHLEGFHDRDAARSLTGVEIVINRSQLAATGEGEYYWVDLIGLQVLTTDGELLGTVDHLLATGANDVLVVQGERERLIPFIQGDVVTEVDLEQGLIRIDWDTGF